MFYPALRVAGLTRGECSWRGEAGPAERVRLAEEGTREVRAVRSEAARRVGSPVRAGGRDSSALGWRRKAWSGFTSGREWGNSTAGGGSSFEEVGCKGGEEMECALAGRVGSSKTISGKMTGLSARLRAHGSDAAQTKSGQR